jgi:predicted O-linked N-acetylglucosamine transferase (SPINDLY family)
MSDSALAPARDLLARGAPQAAREWLQANPPLPGDTAEHAFLLGVCQLQAGQPRLAVAPLEHCLALDPAHSNAANALATALHLQGKNAQACQVLRLCLEYQPAAGECLLNLGRLLEMDGDPIGAIAAYGRVPAAAPALSFPAGLRRATLLSRMGQTKEALTSLCRLTPGNTDESQSLRQLQGEILLAAGRAPEAEALLAGATDACLQLLWGMALAAQARWEPARTALGEAWERAPGERRHWTNPLTGQAFGLGPQPSPLQCFTGYHRQQAGQGEWAQRQAFARESAAYPLIPTATDWHSAFALFAAPLAAAVRRRLADGWADALLAAMPPAAARPQTRARQDGPLRIAYLSPDFGDHAMGHCLRSFCRHHDRRRYHITLYADSRDDGSEVRRQLRREADEFTEVYGLSDGDLERRLARDGIQILVDLAGYTRGGRPRLARRPGSPLKVLYQGYPGTLGKGLANYALVDRHVCPPGSEAHWAEALIRLPDSFFLLDSEAPPVPLLEAAELGAPAAPVVFACFNQSWKVDAQAMALWQAVLAAVPEAVLWLHAETPAVAAALTRRAAEAGIGAAQLHFSPGTTRPRYLARYRHVHAVLDTPLYHGHGTGADALGMGTPVLSLQGEGFQARVGGSLVRALGLPQLAAESAEAYVATAIRLGRDEAWRQTLVADIRRGCAVDGPLGTRHRVCQLEQAYAQIWQRHRAGLAPASFTVEGGTATENEEKTA